MRRFLVILLFACTAAGFGVDGETSVAAPGGARCSGKSTFPLTSPHRAYYAVVKQSATAYRRPGGEAIASFGRLNVNRASNVFGVLGAVAGTDCMPRWFRVQLPLRPNGLTGYVRAADVSLGFVTTRVLVDLSERRVSVFRGGKEVLRTRAAVGSPATPTPTGRYYVNQRLATTDASGPFGPGGIGISAFSPVLTDWPQGGPVAIHGTNQPWLIGRAASSGCVRVENSALRSMWTLAREGTPVVIRP